MPRSGKGNLPSRVTMQRLLNLATVLDEGPVYVPEAQRAAGLTPKQFSDLLTTAENVGLLLYVADGEVGALNSASWRDGYAKQMEEFYGMG